MLQKELLIIPKNPLASWGGGYTLGMAPSTPRSLLARFGRPRFGRTSSLFLIAVGASGVAATAAIVHPSTFGNPESRAAPWLLTLRVGQPGTAQPCGPGGTCLNQPLLRVFPHPCDGVPAINVCVGQGCGFCYGACRVSVSAWQGPPAPGGTVVCTTPAFVTLCGSAEGVAPQYTCVPTGGGGCICNPQLVNNPAAPCPHPIPGGVPLHGRC